MANIDNESVTGYRSPRAEHFIFAKLITIN